MKIPVLGDLGMALVNFKGPLYRPYKVKFIFCWGQGSDTLRQARKRKISAPRPYETDPFYPLSSIGNNQRFLCLYESIPIIYSMWYVEVVRCEFVNYRKRSIRNIQPKASKDYSSHREKTASKTS